MVDLEPQMEALVLMGLAAAVVVVDLMGVVVQKAVAVSSLFAITKRTAFLGQ